MPGIIQNTFNQALMMGAAASAGIDYMKKQHTPAIEAFNAEAIPERESLQAEGEAIRGAETAVEGQASMLPLAEDVRDEDRQAYESALHSLNKREELVRQQRADWQRRVDILRNKANDIYKKTKGWSGRFGIPTIAGTKQYTQQEDK